MREEKIRCLCMSTSPYSPGVDFALVQFAHCGSALISHQILHGRLYAIGGTFTDYRH